MAPVERRALASVRTALLSGLSGRVLEIGAGTGANLRFYPADVRLLISEPDREMRGELRPKLQSFRKGEDISRVLAAEAERIPLGEASVDFVVATLVLCSVEDPLTTAREIRRVLRPEGRLLFVEHVRADGNWGACQDRLQPLWSKIGCGCHPNRDTPSILREAGFEFEELRAFDPFEGVSRPVHFLSRIVLPFVRGIARKRTKM